MKTYFSYICLSGLLALVIAGCHSPSKPPEQPAGIAASTAHHAPEANLTQLEAEERARLISNVRYEVAARLDRTSDRFKAEAKIRFDWKPDASAPAKGSFLELGHRAKILSFAINGVKSDARFENHRVILPAASLKSGANVVEIGYDQAYARDGRGLHRFVDPEDKNVYLYTQFEAYDAHQFFPCFDQPDLKARMDLSVSAPAEWTVISTTRELSAIQQGENRLWIFPTTPLMSTYLFSLHAGPYHLWESKAGRIPLRLFARRSLARFVHPQDWFRPTQQGLKFFGGFFGVEYPFKKYDQVIAPEFNAGAMENIAAITFSERFLSRGTVTRDEREDLAEVILHEMAHQWFGNLVTMRWWNGLWLNESFATYMAQLAKARATEFKDAWVGFSLHQKSRAYLEDQLVTTHPVEGQVADTDSAFANFDSITYGKGASTLKQLSFFIGEDRFRNGLKRYFRRHSYGNTTIVDFLGALEAESGKNLADWSKSWLRTAGVDTVRAEFECSRGRITRFELKAHGPGGSASERPHRMRIALYKQEMGNLLPYKVVTTDYRGPATALKDLNGATCPAMVFPNDDDHDYVKVQLDRQSLNTVLTGFEGLRSPQARAMLWPGLFDAIRDLELKPQDYLALAAAGLAPETDAKSIEAIVRRAAMAFFYLPQATANEQASRLVWKEKFEILLWKKMSDPKVAIDTRLAATDGYVRVAESSTAQQNLLNLLKSDTLDQDRRWGALIRLSSLGTIGADDLIARELKRDSSERGIKMAYAAEAAAPQLERKLSWVRRVIAEDDLSFSQKNEVFQNLLPATQMPLRLAVAADFYTTLPTLAKTKNLSLVNLYARSLLPADCTPAPAEKLAGFLRDGATALPAPVLKSLRTGYQEDEICRQVRARATTNTASTGR